MRHLRNSFFISTQALAPELDGCRGVRVAGYRFGAFSEDLLPAEGLEQLTVLFETVTTERGARPTRNSAVIDGNTLTVRGSDMNTQPVYYIVTKAGQFVLFNDLFLARGLLSALGQVPHYDARTYAADLTFFESVSRLLAGEQLTVRVRGGSVEVHKTRLPNLLEAAGGFHTDIEHSKATLFHCLEDAVKRGVEDQSTVNIALSGGVDSGTIAYLIGRNRCRLKAYTLGTDWGNEYAEAQETADALGVELEQVYVSKDEILREIPHIIRFFHFINPENIEIALVAHCLYKKLFERGPAPRRFLTGYGSDLLNGGGITHCQSHEQLQSDILRELTRTQRSNEFSNLAALHYGVHVHHPFWESDVIRCALQVPATYKLRGEQDKFYARAMMSRRLPDGTVWRKKLGAHRGTGLSQHLRDVFKDSGGNARDGASGYQHMIEQVHQDIFHHGNYPRGAAS